MRAILTSVYAVVLIQIIAPTISDTPPPSGTKDISNEDIRAAILSLIHMFRDNADKFERHEYRERQLGDQLKKTLGSIEKKQKTEENGQILETLHAINRRLESIEKSIPEEKNASVFDISSPFQVSIQKKMNEIEESIQRNELVLESVRSNSIQRLDSLLLNIQQSQSSINSFEQKFLQSITTGNSELTGRLETKFVSFESLRAESEKIQTTQQKLIEQITAMQQSINDYGTHNGGSCQLTDSVKQKLDELSYSIQQINENDTVRSQEQLDKTHSLIKQNHQTILSTVSETAILSADGFKSAEKKYDELLKEFKDLSQIEPVLIQTADNILDTKRRIEYSTHQILVEVGELVKGSSKETNETVNRRFDTISAEILNSTNGALQNLSSKLETEISQVWRQIGIMYQTLTNSADALDKLQIQTEIYVNGSLTTMDNMQGKVGQITGRMSEVDENLNYLLGRLSLVTQEFNQIKTGLGQALDNIRKSFHTVQDKVKDSNPDGRNPIEEDEDVTGDKTVVQNLNSGGRNPIEEEEEVTKDKILVQKTTSDSRNPSSMKRKV